MSRFFQQGGEYFFDPEEDGVIEIHLDEVSLLGYEHRNSDYSYLDRVAILDPSDGEFWSWYRANTPDEHFDPMLYAAQEVGSYVLRSTPLPEVEETFASQNSLTDEDIEALLGASDEQG